MASTLHRRLRFVKRELRRDGSAVFGSCAFALLVEGDDVPAPEEGGAVFALEADRSGEVGMVKDRGDTLPRDPANLAYLVAADDRVGLGRVLHACELTGWACVWSSTASSCRPTCRV